MKQNGSGPGLNGHGSRWGCWKLWPQPLKSFNGRRALLKPKRREPPTFKPGYGKTSRGPSNGFLTNFQNEKGRSLHNHGPAPAGPSRPTCKGHGGSDFLSLKNPRPADPRRAISVSWAKIPILAAGNGLSRGAPALGRLRNPPPSRPSLRLAAGPGLTRPRRLAYIAPSSTGKPNRRASETPAAKLPGNLQASGGAGIASGPIRPLG